MKIATHTIKASRGARHSRKRVGRGNASGHGTFSTRGLKGQRSRSGGKAGLRRRAIKELVQSTPKLRGFKSLQVKPATITLLSLDKNFKDGDKVDIASLKEKGLIKKNIKSAKVVSTGDLSKKLTVELPATKSAADAITKAGGKLTGGLKIKEEVAEKAAPEKKEEAK